MGTRSSVQFVRVQWSWAAHPKVVGDGNGEAPLTAAERGTWLTALIQADIAYPSALSEGALRALCPGATFEQLYERQLLDPDDRPGWFRVHDLEQFHRSPSATPEAVRERVARHRNKRNASNESNARGEEIRVEKKENEVRPPKSVERARQPRRSRTSVSGFTGPFDPTP